MKNLNQVNKILVLLKTEVACFGFRKLGICGVIMSMYNRDLITAYDKLLIDQYLQDNRPSCIYRNGYWFTLNLEGNLKRIEWIQNHIERTKLLS